VKPEVARTAARVEYDVDTGPFPRKGKMAVKIEG
jgi:hypothetical protein